MNFLYPLSALLICVVLLVLSWKKPSLLLYFSLSFLLLGEIGRFSLPGMDQEILFLDLFILLSFPFYILRGLVKNHPLHLGKLFIPLLLFICIALFSLLLSLYRYEAKEVVVASFYLLRFIVYAFLSIIALNEKIKPYKLFLFLLIIALALSALGFFQFVFFPDFSSMETFGWDPHIGRLLSTWFDPNFMGGFLSFALLLLLNILFDKKLRKTERIFFILSAIILFVALVLTFSRSAYVMFIVGIFLTGLRAPKMLLVFLSLSLLFYLFIPRMQERVNDLAGSMFAFATNSYDYGLDETAKLRVASWEESLSLFSAHPLLGIGYDTMLYEKLNRGDITDPTIHSGSGADSSLLTILVTTGIIGFLSFVWIMFTLFVIPYKTFRQKTSPPFVKNFALGFIIALIALLVHSFFVNSLLLPFFLVPLFIMVGTLENNRKVSL